MKVIDAIRILRRFEDYREGFDIRTMTEAGIDEKELTEAINKICEFHGVYRPITNCLTCNYRGCDIYGSESCILEKCNKGKK